MKTFNSYGYDGIYGKWFGSFGVLIMVKKKLSAWVIGFEVFSIGLVVFVGPLCFGIGTINQEKE